MALLLRFCRAVDTSKPSGERSSEVFGGGGGCMPLRTVGTSVTPGRSGEADLSSTAQ